MQASPDLTVKVTRKIADIRPDEWNGIFPDILENYHFLKSIDESDFEGFSFYYILVYEKNILIGAAPCFIMNYSLDTTAEGVFKNLLAGLKGLFPGVFNLKVLVCGSPASRGNIGIAGENAASVIKAIVNTMEDIARAERATIIAFKDFSSAYANILGPLLKKGFYKVASYPSVEIDIKFKSFDDYLKTLSRATRKDLKRKFKHAEALAKIELEIADDIGGLLDEAYGLYLETYSKSDVRFEKMPRDFLLCISKNMPGRVKYFLWRIDGKLAAFDLCLASEDVLIDEYIGMDYRLAHKYNLYFITFRDVMNWCMANGIKRYESGALTYEPKRRLGCRFIPLFVYVKHINRFINPFFRILPLILRPENFDRVLKAMKKEGRL